MVVDLGIKCGHLHQITAERRLMETMEAIMDVEVMKDVEAMNTAVVETNIIVTVTEVTARETMATIVMSTNVEMSIIVMATSTTVMDTSIIDRTSTIETALTTMREAAKFPTTNP